MEHDAVEQELLDEMHSRTMEDMAAQTKKRRKRDLLPPSWRWRCNSGGCCWNEQYKQQDMSPNNVALTATRLLLYRIPSTARIKPTSLHGDPMVSRVEEILAIAMIGS